MGRPSPPHSGNARKKTFFCIDVLLDPLGLHFISSICFQASTCYHLLYFTILSLKDIQSRLKTKKTTQSQHTINTEKKPKTEEQSHLRPAMCLILIHLLAVVISCTNIYIEQVSVNSYSLEILRIVFILDCCRISKNGVASSSHLLKSG